MTRGDYQELLKAGLTAPEAIETASQDSILACVSGDVEKAQIVREAATAIKAEPQPTRAPALPDYEG